MHDSTQTMDLSPCAKTEGWDKRRTAGDVEVARPSVLAPGTALRSVPTARLSSAQVEWILTSSEDWTEIPRTRKSRQALDATGPFRDGCLRSPVHHFCGLPRKDGCLRSHVSTARTMQHQSRMSLFPFHRRADGSEERSMMIGGVRRWRVRSSIERPHGDESRYARSVTSGGGRFIGPPSSRSADRRIEQLL